jgi:acetoin utilization deacetylase AcuC-like enzyme
MKRVALFTHPACLRHDPGHPECPDRLRAIVAALDYPDFVALRREHAPEATAELLSRAHPAEYVAEMFALAPEPGDIITIDGDTFIGDGGVAGVDATMQGWADAAFAAVRPPGHHAERSQAVGFCLFASAAIAAPPPSTSAA